MTFNLTENQKALAKALVVEVREKRLNETFTLEWAKQGRPKQDHSELQNNDALKASDLVRFGAFSALVAARLLISDVRTFSRSGSRRGLASVSQPLYNVEEHVYSLTARAYEAVDSNFADEPAVTPVSTLAQPHPPEIAMSLDRLRTKYPDPKKLGFLVMRFTAAKPFARIVEIIKETAAKFGVVVVRADENEFHADLWGNVRTHLHGCGFGIAVYERIETDEPNANVGLEVGYLMAMNKPVLLLKDKTVQTLQADLAGKLYKEFDPHDPEATVPDQLNKWLENNGIIVPRHT